MSNEHQDRLTALLAEDATARDARDGMPTFVVAREDAHRLLARLKGDGGFSTLSLVTAIDRMPREPRFEVYWQLLSLEHKSRVRIVCDVPEDDARVATVTDLWPGAGFGERETYDMFGIEFDGGTNERLLMPDGYDHFPLRKDFPHQGIEPDRLYREWERERRAEVGER